MIYDLRTIHYCFSAGGPLDLFWSVFMAGCHSLPTWYGFSWPVGAWQLSQGWTWTRLQFPGLPMLNPCWIINATSSSDGFWLTPRIQNRQKYNKTVDTFTFNNLSESGLKGSSCIWICGWIFIGTVLEVTSSEVATIQFLNRVTDCIQMPKDKWCCWRSEWIGFCCWYWGSFKC